MRHKNRFPRHVEAFYFLVAALAAGAGIRRAIKGDPPERGDVPGWVMITLMSAVLVAALLAIAGPALQGLFEQAMNQVSR